MSTKTTKQQTAAEPLGEIRTIVAGMPAEEEPSEGAESSHWNIPRIQLVKRTERPDEPVYKGPGSSVRSYMEDVASGFVLTRFRSGAATRIDWKPTIKSKKERDRWNRMDGWNDGNRNNWNSHDMDNHEKYGKRACHREKKDVAEAICSSLPVNVGEQRTVLWLCTKFDYSDFGTHRAIERGILALISVVVETLRPRFGADFQGTRIHCHDVFKSHMAEQGITVTQLNGIKRNVRSQLERYAY